MGLGLGIGLQWQIMHHGTAKWDREAKHRPAAVLRPAQVASLQQWLKAQPASRRPLVKLNSRVAPEGAVKMLQSAMPPVAKEQPEVRERGQRKRRRPRVAATAARGRGRGDLGWRPQAAVGQQPRVIACQEGVCSVACSCLLAYRDDSCRLQEADSGEFCVLLQPQTCKPERWPFAALLLQLELENVAPPLLLPPAEKGAALTAALAGGTFDLGDRVVAIGSSGVPPFGARGTVVGVLDDAVEVGGGASAGWRGVRG